MTLSAEERLRFASWCEAEADALDPIALELAKQATPATGFLAVLADAKRGDIAALRRVGRILISIEETTIG